MRREKIKLSELRNAEIAFVPAGKGISTSECNAVVEGERGHNPQKIFEMQLLQ